MNYTVLIILLPLLGAVISGLCIIGKRNILAEVISTLLVCLSALMSIHVYFSLEKFIKNITIYEWIKFSDLSLNFSIYLDPLTSIMFCVVTIVSAVVHIFSIGYMHSDKFRARFFCYLSLFTFAMLILVCSDNFIQLFLGWEGVGLCSYLLVGFYFHKPSANNAAIKAFLVNRVGDFGYLIAIALIYKYFNTLSFSEVFQSVYTFKEYKVSFLSNEFNLITVITMFLFLAAVGKSAQIGLHVWLPDAMEGPTPVSALIHAATMVTAGVFLVVRCSPLFEYSQFTLNFITYIGIITSIFAASVALLQDDIKKVIAYSTCSQLGYMFFACGISAYSLAMFHLVTHAFFKALLFLAAGSVIHSLHHEQNFKNMGELYKKLPITYFFVIVGSLALTGIPPFAGYFSKDLILEFALSKHTFNSTNVYIFGCLGAFLTAIYSTRLLYFTFHGKSKISPTIFKDIKEPPYVMIVPLFILAIGAIFGGYIFYNLVYDNSFWKDSIFTLNNINYVEEAHHIDKIFKLIPIILVVTAFIIVFGSYKFIQDLSSKLNKYFGTLTVILKNKWYFDSMYNYLFVKKLLDFSKFLWTSVDIGIIDLKGPIGVSAKVMKTATYFRKIQNGKIFSYAIFMFAGIVVFAGILFF